MAWIHDRDLIDWVQSQVGYDKADLVKDLVESYVEQLKAKYV